MKKEELLKFYLNYRFYIFPAVAALSCLILVALVIYPQSIKLSDNQRIRAEVSKRLSLLEVKAASLESYEEEDLKNKVQYTLNSYPTEEDFANVVGILQNLTAQAGFNIVSLGLGQKSGKDAKIKSYSVKLDLVGPVRFFPVLLNNIESSSRLMRVSSIESSIGRDAALASMTLNVEVLYSGAPTGFGSVDSPLPELSGEDEEVLGTLVASVGLVPEEEATASATPKGKSNPFE